MCVNSAVRRVVLRQRVRANRGTVDAEAGFYAMHQNGDGLSAIESKRATEEKTFSQAWCMGMKERWENRWWKKKKTYVERWNDGSIEAPNFTVHSILHVEHFVILLQYNKYNVFGELRFICKLVLVSYSSLKLPVEMIPCVLANRKVVLNAQHRL